MGRRNLAHFHIGGKMKASKRYLYHKKRLADLQSTISSQEKQIKLLEKENEHLKEDNVRLGDKLSEIYVNQEQIYSEYSEKITELNRIISGYEAAKKSLETIRREYEKKVNKLIEEMKLRGGVAL